MRKDLITEARNPASEDLDKLSTIDFVRLVNSEDAKVSAAVAEQAEPIATAIDLIVMRLAAGGVSSTWEQAPRDVSVYWMLPNVHNAVGGRLRAALEPE